MHTEASNTTPPSNIISNIIKKMPFWLKHPWKLYFLGLSVPIGLIVWGVRSIPPGFDMLQNVNSPTYVAPPATTWLISIGAAILVCYLVFVPLLICDELPEAQGKWREEARKQCNQYFHSQSDDTCFSPFKFMFDAMFFNKDYDLNNIFIDSVLCYIKELSIDASNTSDNLWCLQNLVIACKGNETAINRRDESGRTGCELLEALKSRLGNDLSDPQSQSRAQRLNSIIDSIKPEVAVAVPVAENSLYGVEAGQGAPTAAAFCAAVSAAAYDRRSGQGDRSISSSFSSLSSFSSASSSSDGD